MDDTADHYRHGNVQQTIGRHVVHGCHHPAISPVDVAAAGQTWRQERSLGLCSPGILLRHVLLYPCHVPPDERTAVCQVHLGVDGDLAASCAFPPPCGSGISLYVVDQTPPRGPKMLPCWNACFDL